jgi:hypothetical protein
VGQTKVLVLGDGPNELGDIRDVTLPSGGLPPLPRLLHRVLGESPSLSFEVSLFGPVGHIHGKGPKYAKKVKLSIIRARQKNFDGLVILIDRDRRPDSETLCALERGRDEMMVATYPSCAVGVAVETFDAWMIVDGRAIAQAGGTAARAHGDPEKLDGKEGSGRHPKDLAGEILGGEKGLGARYATVAQHVRLDLLKERCPKGFGRFAEDIQKHILPVVKD